MTPTRSHTVPRLDPLADLSVAVPGSKSIANRALVCAALANGPSTITNLPDGDDVAAMLSCLEQLGIGVERGDDSTIVTGTRRVAPASNNTIVHAGLAGTTSRFLAAVSALSDQPITLDGHAPLRARPFEPLFAALRALGTTIETPPDATSLPATISGPPTGSTVTLPGDISSQFVTALMLIAPMLPSGLVLNLSTDLVSRPYVEMTAAVMQAFGSGDIEVGQRRIAVPTGGYRPTDFHVEPDASSASYPLGLAAMLGGSATVAGLGNRSLQGDAEFAQILGRMGCDLNVSATDTTVWRPPERALHGITIDMADISDLVPTMAVVAATATSETVIDGVGFIRHKESDRLGDLAAELTKLGVDIVEADDGLVIAPSAHRLRPATVDTHHDHRLAMAFGLVGSLIGDVVVNDPNVVTKSWPGFWAMLDGANTTQA